MSRFLGRTKTRGKQPGTPDTITGEADGTARETDISSTDYTRRCRLLMDLSKDLRDMG